MRASKVVLKSWKEKKRGCKLSDKAALRQTSIGAQFTVRRSWLVNRQCRDLGCRSSRSPGITGRYECHKTWIMADCGVCGATAALHTAQTGPGVADAAVLRPMMLCLGPSPAGRATTLPNVSAVQNVNDFSPSADPDEAFFDLDSSAASSDWYV